MKGINGSVILKRSWFKSPGDIHTARSLFSFSGGEKSKIQF